MILALVLPVVVQATTDPVPVVVRAIEHRYAAEEGEAGHSTTLERRHVEHFDARRRLQRWEDFAGDGSHELTWIGLFLGDAPGPDRAAYWSAEGARPVAELFVHSGDGRFQDVLYPDGDAVFRRQRRDYFDAAGREVYQEYFAPESQRRYGEEIYRYDDDGNELGREWRRLDGRAAKRTDFEILERDRFGAWTRRLVYVDGELTARDEREIEYGSAMRPRSPASAGPVERSDEILPVPFGAGSVTTAAAGENVLTFAPDGRTVLFTRYDEWTTQRGFFSSWRDGRWQEAEPVPFADAMYNAAFSEDGERIVYCVREDAIGGGRVYVTERSGTGWSAPVDLTERDGVVGSYFRLLTSGALYYHVGGDLHRAVLNADGVRDRAPLGPPINTPDGTEFGAWVDSDEELLIFTRGVEGSDERSGLFAARRSGAGWGAPRKLPVPYGWGAVVTPRGDELVYVIDDGVYRVPLALLELP